MDNVLTQDISGGKNMSFFSVYVDAFALCFVALKPYQQMWLIVSVIVVECFTSQLIGLSSVLSNPASHELSHLGLRPHEIRDLIRRGLWPRHPTDEDRGISSLHEYLIFCPQLVC